MMRQLLLLLCTVFALGISLDKTVGQTISAARKYSLAVKPDGEVIAWGSSKTGLDIVPAGLADVLAIDAGDNHVLALLADSTIEAWGYNKYHQCNIPYGLSDVVEVKARDKLADPTVRFDPQWARKEGVDTEDFRARVLAAIASRSKTTDTSGWLG